MNNYSIMVLRAYLDQQEALKRDNDKCIDNFILDKEERHLAYEKKEVIEDNIKDLIESLKILEEKTK